MSGDGKRGDGQSAPSYRAHLRLYPLPHHRQWRGMSENRVTLTVAKSLVDRQILTPRRRGRHNRQWCRIYRRALRSRILSKPRFISVKRASIIGSNSQSVKMYGQSFSIPSRTSSPT
jgi:hypothetical protein